MIGAMIDLSLTQACAAASRWTGAAADLPVSVNLSASQLQRRDLVDVVARVLAESGLAPSRLELEIQERSTVDRARSQAETNIMALRDLGIRITIDRFGREVASMLSMRSLPIGAVKLDRSLVGEVSGDPQAMEIVRATVDVSERFNITVVAVGVETGEQLRRVRSSGCHRAQGNLLGEPMSSEDFVKRYLM